MTHKSFYPIEQRDQLHKLKSGQVEPYLVKACKELEVRLKTSTAFMNVNEWSSSNVRDEIRRITGEYPNHTRQTPAGKRFRQYKGLYAWTEKDTEGSCKPIYIGISQNLAKRISDHAKAKNKSQATWAYMMAKHGWESGCTLFNPPKSASALKMDKKYDFKEREHYQKLIRETYQCTILLEDNDYLLYMLEVYASIWFKSFWNTFQTH